MDLGALQSRAQSGKKAVSNVECTCSNQQNDVVDCFLSAHGSIECLWIIMDGRLATVYGRHTEQTDLRIIQVVSWCLT